MKTLKLRVGDLKEIVEEFEESKKNKLTSDYKMILRYNDVELIIFG